MEKNASLSLVALALLLAGACLGHAAPYFPYDYIEDYYKNQPEQPAAGQPGEGQEPPAPTVTPRPRAGQPVAVTAPPEFLFPEELGFGVAVGVPYDMMYLSEEYYYWQAGAWYRSSSYRGPWTELGYSQLPPELRKQTLAQIRKVRDREFGEFWKDKEQYKGKEFRPGGPAKQ